MADPEANPELIAAGHLQYPRMAAGDVMIFLAATQSHVSRPNPPHYCSHPVAHEPPPPIPLLQPPSRT